jgi:hypothetical protein
MKKKYHERSDADKRRIDKWVAMKAKQGTQGQIDHHQAARLVMKNKKFRKFEHDIVSKIISVTETPRSLALKYTKWREKHPPAD